MIGSDTNILVRAVLDDHPIESNIAKKFLKKMSQEKKLFISSYAILEMVWVLKVKKRSRKEIYESILDLLNSSGVIVGQREIISAAAERYIKGKADFGDYLILSEGEFYHSTKVASFDKNFAKDSAQTHHPKMFL